MQDWVRCKPGECPCPRECKAGKRCVWKSDAGSTRLLTQDEIDRLLGYPMERES